MKSPRWLPLLVLLGMPALFLAPVGGIESVAPAQVASSTFNAASGDWKPASPREEIKPSFSFNPHGGPKQNGSWIITADERAGLHGWWQKTFPVTGGKHYRFHALRKVHDV